MILECLKLLYNKNNNKEIQFLVKQILEVKKILLILSLQVNICFLTFSETYITICDAKV